MSFVKKRVLMHAFIQAQFSFCPLLWMFCSKKLHDKINSIHKRALQNVYLDYTSTFEELLKKDNSVTIHHRTIQLLAIEMFKVVNKCGPELIRDLFKLTDHSRSRSKRALQNVYLDYKSTFEELLKKDNSVTIHHRTIQLLAIEMFKVVNKCGPELIRNLFKLTDDSRSRSKRAFFRPNVNHEQYGKESIRYFGTIVWDDMLPAKYKSIKKLKRFKEEIKKWTPTNCPCSLCKEYVGGVGYVTTFE